MPALVANHAVVHRTLRITPGGELRWDLAEGERDIEAELPLEPVISTALAEKFERGAGFGLLYLGAALIDTPLPAGLTFFRDFAQRLVSAICALPNIESQRAQLQVPPPPLAPFVAAAPPMRGLEYLTEDVLQSLWQQTAAALVQELTQFAGLVEAYLQQQNPAWHTVGRICFHLAENPRDETAPFAFLCTYARSVRAGGPGNKQTVQHVPLAQALKEYARAEDKPALISLLAPVQRAAGRSEFCKKLVDSGQIYHPLRFSPRQAYRMLREVPALEAAGVVVRLPDFWKARRVSRPQVQVRIGEKAILSAETLLDFSVQVALGDEALSAEEWQALMQSDEPLIRLRGQWVELDRERLQEVLSHWERVQDAIGRDGLSFIEGMRLLAGARIGGDGTDDGSLLDTDASWSTVATGAALTDLLKKLRDPAALQQIEETLGVALKTTLRPYQALGVRWLHFLASLGLGGCLADDMGLGKTVQVLALLLLKKGTSGNKPTLLVVPASLLANWCTEAMRFAPSLRVLLAHPSSRQDGELSALTADEFLKYDLVITSYGYLQRLPQLQSARFEMIILDEAQAIKNPGAKQTRACKALRGDVRLALTGTPIENQLSDLWSLFDFLQPGLLGSAKEFQRFVMQLKSRAGQGGSPSFAPLRELVRPYILRRMKSDPRVINDLPDKSELVAYCALARSQAVLYQRTVEELAQKLATLDGIERRGAVLSCLMRLKQICNHPAQALGHGRFDEANSGKLFRLRELCESIAARQEKVLVFTQFREMCAPLWEFLSGVFGRPGLVLHGETAVQKRQELVGTFHQTDGGMGPPFFVLSLKAGGTGLNLTAASHVIHFDRWWNPAVEDQATDRAYRIGQKKNVLVHKLVCRGTLEERIDNMLRDKRGLVGEVLSSSGELPLTELKDDEIMHLLTLDVNRALSES